MRRSTDVTGARNASMAGPALLLTLLVAIALAVVAVGADGAEEAVIEHPAGPDDSCVDCHDDLLAEATTLHLPAEEEFCDACHAVEEQLDTYTVATPGGDGLCLECHESELKEGPENGSMHGLLLRDACIVCHDPHASFQPALLRAAGNDLCLSCHARPVAGERAVTALEVAAADYDAASKIHLDEGLTGGHPMLGHPVAGVAESTGSSTTLSCLSCHAPHTSEFPSLMLGDLELCANCHP